MILQIRAHCIGVHEYLFYKVGTCWQPIMTESNAIAPAINVAVDVSN